MPAVFGNKSATVASARLQNVCAVVVGVVTVFKVTEVSVLVLSHPSTVIVA
ncbi:hypothetical protein D3C87_2212530 [compost metagenome]